MFKKLSVILLFCVSINSWAAFEPSLLGLTASLSSIGSDPGFKIEADSPFFIKGLSALNLEYGRYFSSLAGGTTSYGILQLGVKSRIYSTELASIYLKGGGLFINGDSLSSSSLTGLNYSAGSYFKIPESVIQLQAEIGYNYLFSGNADKLNGQSFATGGVISVGFAYPF